MLAKTITKNKYMAITTELVNRTLIIRLDRPAKRNALNHEVTLELDAALNELDDNPEIWCGILTGSDTIFSAGADLATGPGEPTERGGIVGIINRVRRKPLIAAVEGMALGGGMELVFCCDMVVAANNASFGLPEVKRGLMPDFGGAFRAARLLPANIARELLLTGLPMTAERAERLGFVNYLTEPGKALEQALVLAEQITANAPLAVIEALSVFNAELNGDETAIWQKSHAAHERLLKTEDVMEGIGAFFEKRTPRWRGK